MKKGTVPNFMWVVVVIILILAFVVVFWLMSHGWLTGSGDSITSFLNKASDATSGL
ncbi:MAG: hypothetical protein PHZ19_02725 [Candidatus Thermoplasmatota archaeon]|nr:hypothetical protein [Candidatus Thermoplasmatota archaeon]